MATFSLRLPRRAVIAAALTLGAVAGGATPALAAPLGDGTSNTIQLAVTSVTPDPAHHRVQVGGPAQNRLLTGMRLGTVEIITPVERYLLENCMISSYDSGTRLSLNFTQIGINEAPTSPPDALLIESDGTYPPAR